MLYSNPTIDLIIQDLLSNELGRSHTRIILIGEHAQIDVDQLIKQLKAHAFHFLGGIFPGIIFEKESTSNGVVVLDLMERADIHLIQRIEQEKIELPDLSPYQNTQSHSAAFTFVDGLSAGIANFLKQLYHQSGAALHFIGGGAGSLSLEQQPCLFTEDGLFQDAAIVCITQKHIRLGVRHGWTKLVGPFVATKTSRNVLYELNWQNAFEIYQQTILEDSAEQITANNFFDIAKGYPFGIFRDQSEDIVRDPIAVGPEGELICVGEIPENTVLYILKGERNGLIQSAEQAISDCQPEALSQIDYPFIVDCISRTLFLEEDFPK
ncbi:MAG: FIST N-terminal domain-containing protein, partial [Bacteroidota bacterium]